jgi:hypothetical protein
LAFGGYNKWTGIAVRCGPAPIAPAEVLPDGGANVFTFVCPECKKQHDVDDPFTGPFQTQCLRCRNLIQVMKEDIRTGPQVVATGQTALQLVRQALAAQRQASATPPKPDTEVRPAVKTRRRLGWHEVLAGSLVTTSLLSLGVGAYVVFGRGVTPATDKAAHAAPRKYPTTLTSRQQPSAAGPSDKPSRNHARESPQKVATEAAKSAPSANEPGPPRRRAPLEVVRKAIERRFDKKVVVTTVRVEDGNMTLEGELNHWEDLRPAREVAAQALEEAGFGPIRSWDNHLKKPKK